jgi:hypothetical protein
LTRFGGTAGLVAGAATAAFVAIGVSSVKAFMDAQEVMAQTEAVLKSTGGQANVTADDIVEMSQSLRDLTGIDDEAIQASSNLLLTFRDVHNELGKGNDIFDQAQKSILDMATALNEGAVPSTEDLHSATLQLGKALNDPIQGMTALRRAGVSFSESQKEVITSLVESGDLLGAQKLILAEVRKEFGGAAEAAGQTFAGRLAILKSHLEDVQEEIGEALLPALESLLDLVESLVPVVGVLGQVFKSLPLVQAGEDIQQVKEAADGAGAGFGDFVDIVADSIPILGQFVDVSDHASDSLVTQNGVVGDLSDFYRSKYAEAMDTAAEQTQIVENATRALTDAQRENRLATLALTSSFLGILDSADQLAEAQKEVNRLQRQGKTDTNEYEDAVLAALEAQIGLEESVLNYGKELVDAGKSQGEIVGKIKDMGRELGLSKDAVQELINRIQDYIREIDRIPETKTTTITTHFEKTGGGTWQTGGSLQHGGVVERTGLALVHKGEVFSGVNNEMGFGGVNVTVNGWVGNDAALARKIRDELNKLGNRNAGTGIRS